MSLLCITFPLILPVIAFPVAPTSALLDFTVSRVGHGAFARTWASPTLSSQTTCRCISPSPWLQVRAKPPWLTLLRNTVHMSLCSECKATLLACHPLNASSCQFSLVVSPSPSVELYFYFILPDTFCETQYVSLLCFEAPLCISPIEYVFLSVLSCRYDDLSLSLSHLRLPRPPLPR